MLRWRCLHLKLAEINVIFRRVPLSFQQSVSIASLRCLCEYKARTLICALYLQHSTQWTPGFKILSEQSYYEQLKIFA